MSRLGLGLLVGAPACLYLALSLWGADASCGALAGVVGDPFTIALGLAFMASRIWCVLCVPPLLAVYALWAFWGHAKQTPNSRGAGRSRAGS